MKELLDSEEKTFKIPFQKKIKFQSVFCTYLT